MDPITSRAEWIEREALLSFHRACPTEVRDQLGLGYVELETTLLAYARRSASILFNRALGLGCTHPATSDELAAVIDHYRSLNVTDYLIHLHRSETVASDSELARIGLKKGRGWRKFYRRSSRPVEPTRFQTPTAKQSLLRVRKIPPQDRAALLTFGSIVCNSFDLDGILVPVFPALAQDPRWSFFMSFAGEEAAGTGALFVAQHPESNVRCAWTDFGATSPAYRRRGGQAAVMAARLALADAMECEEVMTTTGEAVPGDPQHSYKNILRSGFIEGPLRENWRPNTAEVRHPPTTTSVSNSR